MVGPGVADAEAAWVRRWALKIKQFFEEFAVSFMNTALAGGVCTSGSLVGRTRLAVEPAGSVVVMVSSADRDPLNGGSVEPARGWP